MSFAPDTKVSYHHQAAQRRRLVRALADARDEEYPEREYPVTATESGPHEQAFGRPAADMIMIERILDDMLEKLSSAPGKPATATKRAKPTLRLSTNTQPPVPSSQATHPMAAATPLLPLPGPGPATPPKGTTPPFPTRPPFPPQPPNLAALRAGASQRKAKSRRKLPLMVTTAGLLIVVVASWFWQRKGGASTSATVVVPTETEARTRIALRTLTTVTDEGAWQVDAELSGDVDFIRATPPAPEPVAPAETEPESASSVAPPPPLASPGIERTPTTNPERPPSPAVAASTVAAPLPDHSPATPRPKASIAFQAYVGALRITGVLQRERVRAVIDGRTVFAGDMVDAVLGVRLVGADLNGRLLWFEDATGAQLSLPY